MKDALRASLGHRTLKLLHADRSPENNLTSLLVRNSVFSVSSVVNVSSGILSRGQAEHATALGGGAGHRISAEPK